MYIYNYIYNYTIYMDIDIQHIYNVYIYINYIDTFCVLSKKTF